MNAVKRIVSVAYLIIFVTLVQSENCTVKKTYNGTITRERLMTCPSSESHKDATFCCYDKFDSVDCCNGADHLRHLILKFMPDLLIVLLVIVGLILACCVICICIPCYCIMSRRRPIYSQINGERNNDSHLHRNVRLLRDKKTFKPKRKGMILLTMVSIVLAYVFIYNDIFFIHIKFNINN